MTYGECVASTNNQLRTGFSNQAHIDCCTDTFRLDTLPGAKDHHNYEKFRAVRILPCPYVLGDKGSLFDMRLRYVGYRIATVQESCMYIIKIQCYVLRINSDES